MVARKLAYVAGAAVARKVANDAYTFARNKLSKSKSVHLPSNNWKSKNRSYNSFRDVLYALKYYNQQQITQTVKSNDCYQREFTRLAQGTDINRRDRQILWCKALKFSIYLRNLTETPMFYRWAVLQWHHIDTTIDSETNSDIDLFRGEQATTRTISFDSVSSPHHKNTYKFNNAKYRVYMEGHGMISGTNSTGYLTQTQSSYINISRMFKVDRKIMYEGVSATSCENPIVLVFWTQKVNDFTGNPSTNNELEYSVDYTLMYQD